MAKREISSTLKSLKFMQRAVQKEEKPKKEGEVIPAGDFPSSTAPKRCVVIIEGDPHPTTTRGRMSFLSFNPSIDKLNEEAVDLTQPEACATSSGRQRETMLTRENGTSQDGSHNLEPGTLSGDANGDLKRKQADTSEAPYQNTSRKNFQDDQQSSPSSSSTQNQHKREKLDWCVLRPPKRQNKKKCH
ncbi:scarecrow-like transcription factor 11 (SCL11) [Forsythia ovata]|uniref:Scarecrow-like transcription factor 11 (SCL11) n=1 Tax=Forsythia ovata TaxID=205694 RepID=A0ABD1T747_9LAMI